MGVVVALGEDKRRRAAGIEALAGLVAADLEQVNRLILAKAGSEVALIPEVASHLISSGGKRLRPMLTLAAARMCGYQGGGHINLAAGVEFMHTATLLHDDVVDDSGLRRGKLAARVLWGNAASVLVGDFLLGQAFKIMVEVGSIEALAILADAAVVIAEGEVRQLAAANNMATTEDEYLYVVFAKTASLFAAAAEVGPVLAACGRDDRAAFKSYGANLGLVFQLIDDVLDYSGNAADLGKAIGDDFREGKITLPLVLSYRRGTAADRAFWQRVIEKRDIRDGDFEEALSLLRRHHALDDTIGRARHFGEVARDALAPFPDSPYKSALLSTVDFCIDRAH